MAEVVIEPLTVTEALIAEVRDWDSEQLDNIRGAGWRGTWAGRRKLRSRTFADRERGFRGKYQGPCYVPTSLIEVEYGPDVLSA